MLSQCVFSLAVVSLSNMPELSSAGKSDIGEARQHGRKRQKNSGGGGGGDG
ncbi:hypothetical protein A2U01_0067456 [Trifolium medium]|uniref:Uncharacterized protein n=1 Tax=Trifolium medium TaxID=97028 RepID=A0A392SED3_9FABA|nr:hypothetical protein [Trifolium medium]